MAEANKTYGLALLTRLRAFIAMVCFSVAFVILATLDAAANWIFPMNCIILPVSSLSSFSAVIAKAAPCSAIFNLPRTFESFSVVSALLKPNDI